MCKLTDRVSDEVSDWFERDAPGPENVNTNISTKCYDIHYSANLRACENQSMLQQRSVERKLQTTKQAGQSKY